MTDTPLNPDALEAASRATYEMRNPESWAHSWEELDPKEREEEWVKPARTVATAYLSVAQPVVNRVESLPAKMRMLAWEGGEFEVGEIPEGHVLVGFEMETDRAWSMADKVTIHIERKDTTNGR